MQQLPQQTAVDVCGQPQPNYINYPVVVQPSRTTVDKYQGKLSVSLGVTLIVAACLSFVFNIVDIAVGSHHQPGDYQYYYYVSWSWGFVGHGFWVGVMVGANCQFKLTDRIVTVMDNILSIIRSNSTFYILNDTCLSMAYNFNHWYLRANVLCTITETYNQGSPTRFVNAFLAVVNRNQGSQRVTRRPDPLINN